MGQADIRWKQRFSNYKKAFAKLDEAVRRVQTDYPPNEQGNIDSDAFLDDIIKEGLIQRFEYTHELAWNVMKDFLSEVGAVKIFGSRDASRAAFSAELITDGEIWMDMIKSRNKTSHTYNEETADAIFTKILNDYHPAFQAFLASMEDQETKQA